MARATRTVNPLHFEDLEPHRFEDLVRQLIYDFRVWSKLEATGRSGSDNGIDVRAIESREPPTNVDGEESSEQLPERVWFIQCKREKSLGPTDVVSIVRGGVLGGGDSPYGYILVAACDFSMKARGAFEEEARNRGVQEFYVLGKAELEDMLFQPKYDNLLFAYFGISLQVRRRSLKTSVRARLATKKAAINIIGRIRPDGIPKPVLIRDPSEERYPWVDDISDFREFPRWCYATFLRHYPADHLLFIVAEHLAYVDDECKRWDALLDKVSWQTYTDPEWHIRGKYFESLSTPLSPHWEFWKKTVPDSNKATYKVARAIHYDRILAIDEHGDGFNAGPHVLVEFDRIHGPFDSGIFYFVETIRKHASQTLWVTDENRIEFFPKELPTASKV